MQHHCQPTHNTPFPIHTENTSRVAADAAHCAKKQGKVKKPAIRLVSRASLL